MADYRDNDYRPLWIALAVGAAIGVAYAASRRSRGGLAVAKRVGKTLAEDGADLADSGRNILERLGIIYEEARKVVDEASDLWSHSRKMLRRVA